MGHSHLPQQPAYQQICLVSIEIMQALNWRCLQQTTKFRVFPVDFDSAFNTGKNNKIT